MLFIFVKGEESSWTLCKLLLNKKKNPPSSKQPAVLLLVLSIHCLFCNLFPLYIYIISSIKICTLSQFFHLCDLKEKTFPYRDLQPVLSWPLFPNRNVGSGWQNASQFRRGPCSTMHWLLYLIVQGRNRMNIPCPLWSIDFESSGMSFPCSSVGDLYAADQLAPHRSNLFYGFSAHFWFLTLEYKICIKLLRNYCCVLVTSAKLARFPSSAKVI